MYIENMLSTDSLAVIRLGNFNYNSLFSLFFDGTRRECVVTLVVAPRFFLPYTKITCTLINTHLHLKEKWLFNASRNG